MKITLIVAKTEGEKRPLVLGAWDEYTIDGNRTGLFGAIRQYRATMPATDIRTAEIEVPDGFLESIWKPVLVQGNPGGSGLVGAPGASGDEAMNGGVKQGVSGEDFKQGKRGSP